MQGCHGRSENLPNGSLHARASGSRLARTQAVLVSYSFRYISRNGDADSARLLSSAAYNLNHPLIDDLNPTEDGLPRVITEKIEIGHRGIELAALGGFDKVTWDGASDSYPSKCTCSITLHID